MELGKKQTQRVGQACKRVDQQRFSTQLSASSKLLHVPTYFLPLGRKPREWGLPPPERSEGRGKKTSEG